MITEAAYLFARHGPWIDVVLIHFLTNIASHLKLALSDTNRQQVTMLFGHLTGVVLDLPPHKVAYKI
jgi:hypothetical protein